MRMTTADAFASLENRLLQDAGRTDNCAASLLLLLTPWAYKFRAHDESISVPFCKTMNCLVQAICRTKDDWWKG